MAIQDGLKQTRPFASKAAEATMALLRTANVIHNRIETAMQREGLTAQQYNVLRILRGARAPLPTMEIAERLIERAPGITRLVSNLEKRGLLKREQWPGDRRQVLCQISPAGLRLLERLDDTVQGLDEEVMNGLSAEQIDTLIELLGQLRRTQPE